MSKVTDGVSSGGKARAPPPPPKHCTTINVASNGPLTSPIKSRQSGDLDPIVQDDPKERKGARSSSKKAPPPPPGAPKIAPYTTSIKTTHISSKSSVLPPPVSAKSVTTNPATQTNSSSSSPYNATSKASASKHQAPQPPSKYAGDSSQKLPVSTSVGPSKSPPPVLPKGNPLNGGKGKRSLSCFYTNDWV